MRGRRTLLLPGVRRSALPGPEVPEGDDGGAGPAGGADGGAHRFRDRQDGARGRGDDRADLAIVAGVDGASVMRTVSPEVLDRLRAIDSCTVANAIEKFGVRPDTWGYTGPEIR